MTRIIRFTNLRVPMAVVSIVLIIAGAVGTSLRGGVNLSVDLSGGVSQQFQIAPAAITVIDSGVFLELELTPSDPLLSRPGFLTAQWLHDGASRRVVFDFDRFPTVGSIADSLSTIDGVEVTLRAPLNTPAKQLQPPGFRGLGQIIVLGYIDPTIVGSAPLDRVRSVLSPIERFALQATGASGAQRYIIRADLLKNTEGKEAQRQATEKLIYGLLSEAFGAEQVTIQQTDFVGPSFSRILGRQAVWLVLVAFTLIFGYILFRFRTAFAVGALLALVHDIAIMLGVLGTLQLEISTATIAAVLTIVGYSLNDTIVIFDRIRENEKLMRDANFELVINTSISQSLSRTLITSLTTLLAVLAIYIFSTSSIRIFALSLMIGVVVGTYSSMFVAAPTLLAWRLLRVKRMRRKAENNSQTMTSQSVSSGLGGSTVTEGTHLASSKESESSNSDTVANEADRKQSGSGSGSGSGSVTRVQRKRQTRKRRRR